MRRNWVSIFTLVLACFVKTSSVTAQFVSSSQITSFANPTPGPALERFGANVVAVGTDRVLIGAYADVTIPGTSGAAYLFHTNGTLLTVFTNPTPTASFFGRALAVWGADRLLMGAAFSTNVWLFDTNGEVLMTYTNPVPAQWTRFGSSLAILNQDIAAIAAIGDQALPQGAVFLYTSDGTLLHTITNPHPSASASFGVSLAKLGPDKLVIGAPGNQSGGFNRAGQAYIYGTNGVLLTTITNPFPSSSASFGQCVADLGTERLLVSMPGASVSYTGKFFIYNLVGDRLQTIPSPFFSPMGQGNNERFGHAIVSRGEDMILVSAPFAKWNGLGTFESGLVYAFDTNGTMLHKIRDSVPTGTDQFGSSLSLLSADHLLIGAEQKFDGQYYSGRAYLHRLNVLPLPSLSIALTGDGNQVSLSWPSAYTDMVLEQSSELFSVSGSNVWTIISGFYPASALSNGFWFTNLPVNNRGYFRLRKQ